MEEKVKEREIQTAAVGGPKEHWWGDLLVWIKID